MRTFWHDCLIATGTTIAGAVAPQSPGSAFGSRGVGGAEMAFGAVFGGVAVVAPYEEGVEGHEGWETCADDCCF